MTPEPVPAPDPDELRSLIEEIALCHMPFGMFGPAKYPPKGVVLYDLPVEYLAWFKQNGFPKGKLGRLLEMTWELKSNGLDSLFAPIRKERGGSSLRGKRPRNYDFGE